eukprot:Seg3215.2 transcript_id=Seg3215.2/GoldUCD/mRNA.D3Y31 product=Nicalin-1 protein_id=Seg3215.2/GoldUCD/D3Y31
MLGETPDLLEFLRGLPTPICLLLFVPFVLLTSHVSPVYGIKEFPVFRMQQFDMHGTKYGSRSAVVNLEARPFTSSSIARRCAVAKLSEVTTEKLKARVADGLSALLVLLPKQFPDIPDEDQDYYQQLEVEFLGTEIPIPVYFAYENSNVLELYDKIVASVTSDAATSAVKALTTVASASAYHLVSSASESKQITDFPIISLQSKLPGKGLEDQLPTIAIVAHYDSFGLIPKLATGSDSNGSGAVALLELARLFSKLYAQSGTHGKYNLLFFLSGGGKFNYQGTRKFIDENLEASEISLLSEVDYVICLDSIGRGNSLNFHVSKPPKEGTTAFTIVEEMKMLAEELYPDVSFKMVHKKINLADEMLQWEHERFSIRRLPAGTISHFESPENRARSTIFSKKANDDALHRNIKIIGEALARYIFNFTGKASSKNLEIFSGSMEPDKLFISSWLEQISKEARSAQLINKDHVILKASEEVLKRYTKEVKRTIVRADKKDPEFIFYDSFEAKMSVYSVKPALFDLFLAVGIALYLGVVYLTMENFPMILELLPKPTANGKSHHN